jgi:hypothetical protein
MLSSSKTRAMPKKGKKDSSDEEVGGMHDHEDFMVIFALSHGIRAVMNIILLLWLDCSIVMCCRTGAWFLDSLGMEMSN